MRKNIVILAFAALLLCGCAVREAADIRPSEAGTSEAVSLENNGENAGEPVSYDSLDSTPMGWGFVKRKGKAPDISAKEKDIMAKYDCFFMDYDAPKTLYLTFDEGYENGFTSKILDVLEATKTPAAFFVTGPYLEEQTDLIKRMVNDGHIVGNHTVNHVNLAKSNVDTVKKELSDLSDTAKEKYGIEMRYMRPPEGQWSEKALAVAKDMGYKTVLWSFAYKDWDINAQQGARHAYDSVTPYLHDGAILLLHAVSSDNADALEDIINYAKNQGYTFKSLDELK